MSTIADVARECGVSISTVSRALRGLPNVTPETRALVEATAARLSYVVSPSASALSSGRHRAVAAVVPSMGRWFYAQALEGATAVLRTMRHDMFVIDLAVRPDGREHLFQRSLLSKRADAVIALGIDFLPEERAELRSLSMPAILIGGGVGGMRTVALDDAQAVGLAMRHLLELGHRRIAHIGGENEYGVVFSIASARREAWATALREHGAPAPDDLFVSGGFTLMQAKVAARSLLTRADRPTAIFAGSDEMAIGALIAAAELGLAVPQDLSVIGIDDHDWSTAYGLTTVRQDPREQGAVAARVLLADLDGLVPPMQSELTPHGVLVVRRTTAPPPA